MIDFLAELKRIQSLNNNETFDRATDSLEALSLALTGMQGLCYYGVVTAVPGANQFTIPTLAGIGAGKFDGVTNPYFAFVFRSAGGAAAAPQGEQQPVIGYVTATGVFTTTAFTAAVGVGDEILIVSPYLAAMGLLYGERSGALAYMGQCPAGMAASLNTIVCPNLAMFPNDTFNSGYQMIVLRNANALGVAPEMEMRDITDFVTLTGTFTTTAFSANVEENDIVLIIHNSVAAQISAYGIADAGSGVGIVRDAARVEANDWWNGQTVMMLSGAARGQKRPIADFLAATDDIIPAPNFDAAVAAGDLYVILAHYNPIVPRTPDSADNYLTSEVVGRKDDTAILVKDNASSAMRYLKGLMDAGIAISGTVVDAGPAVTDFDTSLTEVTNNHYNGGLLLFLNGPNAGQFHLIDVYTGANGNVSFVASDQWTDIPVNGNAFLIIPDAGAYLKKIFTAMALAATALSTAIWTDARAAFLDNLVATISVVGSPYSQPNDLVEHDAIVIAAATQLVDIELDMINLTQANTVREYVQVDGATYRQISAKVFPTDFDTGTESVLFTFPQKGQLYKITMQSSVLEGGARNVPYRIMTRDLS